MADFAVLYERLQEERERLATKLAQLRNANRPSSDKREGNPSGKKDEEASQVLEIERRIGMEKNLEDSLSEVEHALEKYRAGTYGSCDSCGQPIEPARLEALPRAGLCLKCKSSQSPTARGK